MGCNSTEKHARYFKMRWFSLPCARISKPLYKELKGATRKVEISKCILGLCDRAVTECSDYVGLVEIKWSEDLCMCGLFVTNDVDVGVLLVSNAISVVRIDGTNPKKVEGSSGRSKDFLRDNFSLKLYNLILKSLKWQRQLSFLTDSKHKKDDRCPLMWLYLSLIKRGIL